MAVERSDALKKVPSVSKFLNRKEGKVLCECFGGELTKFVLRNVLDEIRAKISVEEMGEVPEVEKIAEEVEQRLFRFKDPKGRMVINATGILLHTGLGRAPFADDVIKQFSVFNGYSILQTDIKTGKRCLRESRIESMLRHLTGCEAATVVNNNAAATMLILNTLAEGKEVVVSRGQLIEIGGAFRMPDVMAKSGVILNEIGTTNRTHLKDYKKAVNENTGALIHVHTSNYRVKGFSGTPNIQKLCELRESLEEDVYVIDDLGSGALVPLEKYGVQNEPLVKESIAAGSDVVCFSGDKLICGPQAGIVCGKKELIEKIRKNPFSRMFRVDKMTLAALEVTLVHFVNNTYEENLPFYQMMGTDIETLGIMAKELAHALGGLEHFNVGVEDGFSYIGSGSAPDEGLPTKLVTIKPLQASPNKIAASLRVHMPSVFCRVQGGVVVLDMRTLLKNEFDYLLRNLAEIIWENY